MSLIIKTTANTNSKNLISIPIESVDDTIKHDISDTDFITSYNQLDIDETSNKFLTTDCLTDDFSEYDNNKILSSLGFASYKSRIMNIISDSNNNNVGNIDFSRIVTPALNTLYNCMTDMTDLNFSSIHFSRPDPSEIDTIDTDALFGIADNDSVLDTLKILESGVYRINYTLYYKLKTTTLTDEYSYTPIIKIIRGANDSAALSHHNNVLDSTLTKGTTVPPTQSENASYLVNEETEITDYTFTVANEYFFIKSGSVIFTYNNVIDEYLGIFAGINYDDTNLDLCLFETTSYLHFIANIEYLGSVLGT